MTDAAWQNIPGILTALGGLVIAVFTFWTHLRVASIGEQVQKVEVQTNSMNEKMVASALVKGELVGKDKAEAAALVATALPPLAPIAAAMVEAKPQEIAEWIARGFALGQAHGATATLGGTGAVPVNVKVQEPVQVVDATPPVKPPAAGSG